MQKMHIKRPISHLVSVQVKDQAFNEKGSMYVINYLNELRRACSSSRILKTAAALFFGYLMTGPALAAIKARSTLSANDANKHEATPRLMHRLLIIHYENMQLMMLSPRRMQRSIILNNEYY